MPSIPHMSDTSFSAILRQSNPQGRLDENVVKQMTDTLANTIQNASVGHNQSLAQLQQRDLQKLLQSDSLEPTARRALEKLFGTVDNKPVAPKDVWVNAPISSANSPLFAYFNAQVNTSNAVQNADAVGTKPTAPRGRTVAPPAVIASTGQSNQTTGPTAAPLNFAANAQVQLWALPGSKVRIYNASVLEDGKPKLIKEYTVPASATPNANATPHSLSGAYPTLQAFAEDVKNFMAAPHDGMVLATVPLTPNDDQDATDLFKVTMQTGSRGESDPVAVRMHSYSAFPRFERAASIDVNKMTLQNGILQSSEYAVTPGASLSVYKNGKATNISMTADDNGKISADLSSLGNLSDVAIIANKRNGTQEIVDMTALGLSKIMPDHAALTASWDAAVIKNLVASDVNGRINFTLDHIPDGVSVEVRNPNNGNTPTVFTSQNGKLTVDIKDAYEGDMLNITMKTGQSSRYSGGGDVVALKDFDENRKRVVDHEFTIAGNYSMHNPADAARIAFVVDSLPGLRRHEIKNALELFGPYSRIPGGNTVNDAGVMQKLWSGAKIGSMLGRDWADQGIAHAVASGLNPTFVEGMKIGAAYAKGTGNTLASYEENVVKLVQAGQARIVATGGYSPISGSHGPLRPETVYGPSTYEINIPGAPPLTVNTKGSQPSGWVNPAAIVMTFGLTMGDPNSAKFTYLPPPNWL